MTTTTTTVAYRLEDPITRNGPHSHSPGVRYGLHHLYYSPDDLDEFGVPRLPYRPNDDPYSNPPPGCDDLGWMNHDERAACDSLEGLLEWWGDTFALLTLAGYEVVRYRLSRPRPVGRLSRTQCVFSVYEVTTREVLTCL